MVWSGKLRRRSWLGLALLFVALFLNAQRTLAQADIVVRKTGAEKSMIDITGLVVPRSAPGTDFIQTLERDLVGSGWFTAAPRGRGAISLRGTLTLSARTASVVCETLHSTSGRSYLRSRLSESSSRRLAHKLADDIVEAVKGVRGIASTRIAMIGVQGGRKDVYLCDADGRNMVKVTNQGAVCLSPAWWPDASALA